MRRWRLHLRSASSNKFVFALARIMPDTTLFRTDLDGDARMEGSQPGLGKEASAQGVIQWSERKVASCSVVLVIL